MSNTTMEQLELVDAIVQQLRVLGAPTKAVEDWLESRSEELKREPSDDDRRWPRVVAGTIDEHLGNQGDDRPNLSCQLVVGRAYSLSPGQRDVVRDWFGMTPAPLVEVLECAMFKDGKHVKSVILRSCEHIDPRRRRVMNKFTINEWGKFMSAAKQRDAERVEERAEVEDVLDEVREARKGSKTPKTKVNLTELMNEYGV